MHVFCLVHVCWDDVREIIEEMMNGRLALGRSGDKEAGGVTWLPSVQVVGFGGLRFMHLIKVARLAI